MIPVRTLQRLGLAALAAVLAAAGSCDSDAPAEGALAVPSGREVRLIDVVTNAPGPEGASARFRFLVPGLAQDDFATAQDDMAALCVSYALPRISGTVPEPQQVIISFSAEDVPFGDAAPGVVQFFEAYRPEGDTCIWEQF
jgi:hypothetical protein